MKEKVKVTGTCEIKVNVKKLFAKKEETNEQGEVVETKTIPIKIVSRDWIVTNPFGVVVFHKTNRDKFRDNRNPKKSLTKNQVADEMMRLMNCGIGEAQELLNV